MSRDGLTIVEFPNENWVREGWRGCPVQVQYKGQNAVYVDGRLLEGSELRHARCYIENQRTTGVLVEKNRLGELVASGDALGLLPEPNVVVVNYNDTDSCVFARQMRDGPIQIFDSRAGFDKYISELKEEGNDVHLMFDRSMNFKTYIEDDQTRFPGYTEKDRDKMVERACATGVHADVW